MNKLNEAQTFLITAFSHFVGAHKPYYYGDQDQGEGGRTSRRYYQDQIHNYNIQLVTEFGPSNMLKRTTTDGKH